jgi:hypothetical protein
MRKLASILINKITTNVKMLAQEYNNLRYYVYSNARRSNAEMIYVTNAILEKEATPGSESSPNHAMPNNYKDK